MSDKLEALRLEAETLSGLMVQLAENEIDSDSFAVMSDLGENGQEHDCDLPITETALRAAAVIDQLLAALKEAEQREDRYRQRWVDAVADLDVAGKRNADLEQRLQQPIKFRSRVFEMMNVGGGHSMQVVSVKTVKEIIRAAGFKVEVEGE